MTDNRTLQRAVCDKAKSRNNRSQWYLRGWAEGASGEGVGQAQRLSSFEVCQKLRSPAPKRIKQSWQLIPSGVGLLTGTSIYRSPRQGFCKRQAPSQGGDRPWKQDVPAR